MSHVTTPLPCSQIHCFFFFSFSPFCLMMPLFLAAPLLFCPVFFRLRVPCLLMLRFFRRFLCQSPCHGQDFHYMPPRRLPTPVADHAMAFRHCPSLISAPYASAQARYAATDICDYVLRDGDDDSLLYAHYLCCCLSLLFSCCHAMPPFFIIYIIRIYAVLHSYGATVLIFSCRDDDIFLPFTGYAIRVVITYSTLRHMPLFMRIPLILSATRLFAVSFFFFFAAYAVTPPGSGYVIHSAGMIEAD